jgi:hypothetical protein
MLQSFRYNSTRKLSACVLQYFNHRPTTEKLNSFLVVNILSAAQEPTESGEGVAATIAQPGADGMWRARANAESVASTSDDSGYTSQASACTKASPVPNGGLFDAAITAKE